LLQNLPKPEGFFFMAMVGTAFIANIANPMNSSENCRAYAGG
jgi:hypothetical protein